jgi:hypothetical protein
LELGSFEAAIEHLYQHRTAGHSFPQEAIDWLRQDIKEGRPIETEHAGQPIIVIGEEENEHLTVEDLIEALEQEDAEDNEATAEEEKCPEEA